MAPAPEEPKKGAPLWMVSFGDMMTLILTFFILLVSMSEEQNRGLLAKGVGSFLIALRSFGLPGLMGEDDKLKIFDDVRVRFNLPAEDDPERREEHISATEKELLRSKLAEALRPHQQLQQPSVALFSPDSSTLSDDAREYLDLLAPSLVPVYGQLLVLEGHASDGGPTHGFDNHILAFARSKAVRDYLIERHGFVADRVEARAWLRETRGEGLSTRVVDARLVSPDDKEPSDE